jgi:hypothetical protein
MPLAKLMRSDYPPTTEMLHKLLRYSLATVWLVMGLGCKIIGLVPRHQEIVARILGESFATPLTIAIGFGEVGIAVWILSNYRPRLCAFIQVALVAVMNVIEFILARDLLLFGAGNALFAAGFIAFVILTERTRPCSQL